MENITFERIKNDEIIREYIRRADRNLAAMGYTKHSFGHVTKVAEGAAEILTALGYDERTVELARIAGFLARHRQCGEPSGPCPVGRHYGLPAAHRHGYARQGDRLCGIGNRSP